VGPNTRFETAVRSATQFFAALIGFTLSHLLDAKPDTQIGHRKLVFLFISICLVLRFFFGSANHLWLEYGVAHSGKPARKPHEENWFFIKDLVFLIFFAIATGMLASSKCRSDFFQWSFTLVVFAFAWNLFHVLAGKIWPQITWSSGEWRGWLWPNLIQSVALAVMWIAEIDGGHRMPVIGWMSLPLRLGVVTLLSFCVLLWDLQIVLSVTQKFAVSNSRDSGQITGASGTSETSSREPPPPGTPTSSSAKATADRSP
jgi:hypothetical protein